jgi:6-phosphogluconolactonase (cycloisomerase 2 family)
LDNTFDVIVVGTSFSGSFFLHSYLPKARKNARVLVLERGQMKSPRKQLQHDNESRQTSSHVTFFNHTPEKNGLLLLVLGADPDHGGLVRQG